MGAYVFLDTYLPGSAPRPTSSATTRPDLLRRATPTGTARTPFLDGGGRRGRSAPIFGIERGPISGIAPGAHVIVYRVCLAQGCSTPTRSLRSAGDRRRHRRDQLLDRRRRESVHRPGRAGVPGRVPRGHLGERSAGNGGPGAGTAEHGGPWVTTVGASTSFRARSASTLHLTPRRRRRSTLTGVTLTTDRDRDAGRPRGEHPRRGRALRDAVRRPASRRPARSSLASAARTPCREGLQRPRRRRGRDDPLQPDRRRTPSRTTTGCRRSTSTARARCSRFLAAHRRDRRPGRRAATARRPT